MEGKGTVPGRGGSMGRHVTGRLRGPRWTRVRAQSFPRSYFRVLGGFCTITSTYKGLCGDSCWPDRAFNSKFPTSIPAPLRWGSPLGATIIQHFRVAHKTLKLLCPPKTAKALFLISLMTTVISRRNWEQLQNLEGAN